MQDDSNTIDSPCVSICQLDEDEICQGCGRSLEEIAAWPQASNRDKAGILANAARRQSRRDKTAPN